MFKRDEEKLLDYVLNELEKDNRVLPSLPEVALRVYESLEDESAGLSDVVQIISSDAALSARLIQIANSPLLRSARTIESVEAAVTRMGADMTRNLVTSIAMEHMFKATSDATDKRLRELWEHCTQVAALSHALASQFTKLNPNQALLAGLVHDIGALPIITLADEMPDILSNTTVLDGIIQKAHTAIGAAILHKWHFSPELITVAAEHEDIHREHSGSADIVDVVIVANLESYLGSSHSHAKIDLSTVPAFAKLGLEPEINVFDADGMAETRAALG